MAFVQIPAEFKVWYDAGAWKWEAKRRSDGVVVGTDGAESLGDMLSTLVHWLADRTQESIREVVLERDAAVARANAAEADRLAAEAIVGRYTVMVAQAQCEVKNAEMRERLLREELATCRGALADTRLWWEEAEERAKRARPSTDDAEGWNEQS